MEKKIILILIIIILTICIVFFFKFRTKITGQTISDKDLLAYYDFENNVRDSAGRNNGAIFGDPRFVQGVKGRALSFDGDGDFVLVGDKLDLEQQEFTLSFWAKHNAPIEDYGGGIAKGLIFGNVNQFSYKMDFHEGKITAAITNTAGSFFEISCSVDKEWHMWTMTVGNKELNLYQDGKLVDTVKYAGTIDYRKQNNYFIIGARENGFFSFSGIIDEIKFWNYALTSKEVLEEYRTIIPQEQPTEQKQQTPQKTGESEKTLTQKFINWFRNLFG